MTYSAWSTRSRHDQVTIDRSSRDRSIKSRSSHDRSIDQWAMAMAMSHGHGHEPWPWPCSVSEFMCLYVYNTHIHRYFHNILIIYVKTFKIDAFTHSENGLVWFFKIRKWTCMVFQIQKMDLYVFSNSENVLVCFFKICLHDLNVK